VRVDDRFNLTGFAGWLACAIPSVLDIYGQRLTGAAAIAWCVGFAAFGLAFVLYLRARAASASRHTRIVLLATQTLAGLLMVWTAYGLTKYLSGVSLMLVVNELPYLFPARVAWIWLAAQVLLLAAIFARFFGWQGALSGGGAYAFFHVFALGKADLQRRERMLLAENSRTAERLRIARDLHDALGHHLTALSIQLDVAARKIDGPAHADIREAHAITKLLLGDVRSVVSQLRQSGRVDLMPPLRSVAAQTTSLQVHIAGPDALMLEEAAAAETILRSVQELITNAVRHAGAHNLWISIAASGRGLELHARDDGRGAATVVYGNGLTGMRERFAEAAGSLEFKTAPGRGFEARGFLPVEAAP
jgi:signal transduction histidine kinase